MKHITPLSFIACLCLYTAPAHAQSRDSITMPEYIQTIAPAFDKADTNKDGVLTNNEVTQFYIYAAQISPAPPLPLVMPLYQCMSDLNMPGIPVQPAKTLTQKDVNEAMQVNFQSMDANKDALLHINEVNSFNAHAKSECDKLRAATAPDTLTPEQRQQMQMILEQMRQQQMQHD